MFFVLATCSSKGQIALMLATEVTHQQDNTLLELLA